MDPDRWRRIERLYRATLARLEPERDAFLHQACAGDQSLERQIRSLLSERPENSFLEGPPVTFAASSRHVLVSVLRTGSTISHYKLLEKLGEGGMGVVFKARDKRLKRLVALKFIVSDGVGTPEHERRLLQEARTASSFRHPNIAHIYEVNKAPLTDVDHTVGIFIAMEYVPGKTLSQIISEHRVDLHDVLTLAVQAADALAAAHRAGIIHRDLKPLNIMVDDSGMLKVLDFGLAKVVDFVPEPDGTTETMRSTGHPEFLVGTPPYMSPEQVECKRLDSRSDIFSFGAVLYEMVSGHRAFPGTSNSSILSAVLNTSPVPLQTLRKNVPADLGRIVGKCLEKNPEARYQSGTELHRALLACQAHMRARQTGLQAFFHRPRYMIPATVLLISVALSAAFAIVRKSRVDWARMQALPEISRLVEQGKYSPAFALASQAEKYIPNDQTFAKLWNDLSFRISIKTNPEGADVYWREYAAHDRTWKHVGRTPLNSVRFPAEVYGCWKLSKQGYEDIERTYASLFEGDRAAGLVLSVDLRRGGAEAAPIVKVASGKRPFNLTFPGYEDLGVALDDFWIDKYEVTNKEYREFVRRGGYQKPEYWKNIFRKKGRTLDWKNGISMFRDATGEPGPAGWVQGDYPPGQDDYPVSGVSWYEAAAYAEFAGKALPTIYHWALAAGTFTSNFLIPASNFQGKSAARVGAYRGLSPYGSYDMAGNVKEWCWNEAASEKRYILGGAWNEPSYQFSDTDARSPFDRDLTFGFRCATFSSALPSALLAPVTRSARDYNHEKPVSNQVFKIYKSLYSYDKTPLRAVVESVTDTEEQWKREQITFAAAYGKERVIAYLFLPKKSRPPYQTVIYFPGSNAIEVHSSSDLPEFPDFILRNGRALLWPVYKSTFERGDDLKSDMPDTTIQYRDHVIAWSKDLGRSIDYLETRSDIDHEKLAYLGRSWGGNMGFLLPAIETRLKVCVLLVGGFSRLRTLPEVDPINFAPHVKQPVLMLNGRYDFWNPVETSQDPAVRLLGAQNKDKCHLLYDTAHSLPLNAVIQETLSWYDRYLGAVNTK